MAVVKPLPDFKLPVLVGAAFAQYWQEYFQAADPGLRTAFLTQAMADGLYEALGLLTGINLQAASYVLVLTDKGKTVEMNVAGANTLTVPPNSSVAFPVKSWLNVVQVGAGQTTLTPGAGVTLHSRIGLKLSGQWAMATGYQRAIDEWVFGGALTA